MNELERALDYKFQSPELLAKALRHKSASSDNNERFEFLGDSLINLVIAARLFQDYPRASEGQLSRMRAELVCGNSLLDLARELALSKHLRLGLGEQRSGGQNRASILSDTVEAVIAAVFLDSGRDFKLVETVILQLFSIKLSNVNTDSLGNKDAKTRLQELLQARHLSLPSYQLDSVTGPAHAQNFEVSLSLALLDKPVKGQGSSRKQAEQNAAAAALELLGE